MGVGVWQDENGGARSMVVVVYGCHVEELSSRSARIGCACGSRLGRSWGLSELGSWERKYTCLNKKHCLMYGRSCCRDVRWSQSIVDGAVRGGSG